MSLIVRVECYGTRLAAYRVDGVVYYDVGDCPVAVQHRDTAVALLTTEGEDGLDTESARNLTLMADACLAILEPVS